MHHLPRGSYFAFHYRLVSTLQRTRFIVVLKPFYWWRIKPNMHGIFKKKNRCDRIVSFAYPNELSWATRDWSLKKASGVNHRHFLDDLMFNPLCFFKLTTLQCYYSVTNERRNKRLIMGMWLNTFEVDLWNYTVYIPLCTNNFNVKLDVGTGKVYSHSQALKMSIGYGLISD